MLEISNQYPQTNFGSLIIKILNINSDTFIFWFWGKSALNFKNASKTKIKTLKKLKF